MHGFTERCESKNSDLDSQSQPLKTSVSIKSFQNDEFWTYVHTLFVHIHRYLENLKIKCPILLLKANANYQPGSCNASFGLL